MKTNNAFVLPIAGLVVVLGIAYGLDSWIEALRQSAFQNFAGTLKWLIPTDIAHLVMAGFLLVLVWVFYKANSLPVTLVYLVVGLGFLFYLAAWIALADVIPLPYLEALVPGTFTIFASAMVAVMGLQKIIAQGLGAGRSKDG